VDRRHAVDGVRADDGQVAMRTIFGKPLPMMDMARCFSTSPG